MADGAGEASQGFLTTGRFRLALAVASFLLMEVGAVRSGERLLRDSIFDIGFILGLVWFGTAFAQIFGRVVRRRRSRTALLSDFQPQAATFARSRT